MAKKEENKLVRSNIVGSEEELMTDKRAERYLLFIQNLYSNQVEKYEQSQIFLFPFYVDEPILQKLNSEVLSLLNSVEGNVPIGFSSSTRFQDLSSYRVDSFEEFLEKAGNKKDPENSTLTWKKFFIDRYGGVYSGQISISFITEKKLNDRDMAPGQYHRASIQLDISGSDSNWVERAFANLSPYLDTTKLNGIYRPLWLFRNKTFINISSSVLAWAGFWIGMDISGKILRKDTEISRADVLQQIIDTTNVTEKIDLLSRQILDPIKSVWWEFLIVFLFGALGFAVIYFSGMNLFPRLTPNSHIAIGLANIRAKKYMNAFKFVVFTLLISSIILPLIIKFLL